MTIRGWAAMALALMMPCTAMAQISSSTPAKAPAGYLPGGAQYCSNDGGTSWVPCPAAIASSAASSTPLSGSSATTQTVGPFTPQLGRPINLTLSGAWTGSAQLLRSIDGGTTKSPITIGGTTWASYSSNANEPVWTETEAGATYYLSLAVTSGTLGWRVSQ